MNSTVLRGHAGVGHYGRVAGVESVLLLSPDRLLPADAGSFAIVPCDNTPGNGALAERVVHDLAELVDADLADWIRQSVGIVTMVVDRRLDPELGADGDVVALVVEQLGRQSPP